MTQQWIASRTLADADGNSIDVRIGVPELAPGGEWQCPTQIGSETIAYGRGIDALQALILAHELVRVTLCKRGGYTWSGQPAELSFARVVPNLEAGLTRRLDQAIDAEIAAWSAEMQKRA